MRDHADGRTPRSTAALAPGGARRIAGAVHACGSRHRSRHCIGIGPAVRRIAWRWAPSAPGSCSPNRNTASGRRRDSLPLQDAFAVLFFVSVGMLFDPTVLVRDPVAVLVDAPHHRRRQAVIVLLHRDGSRLSGEDGADGVGQPFPGRRVLLHPRQLGAEPFHHARGGPRPDPRGRDPLDHPEPGHVLRRPAAIGLARCARSRRRVGRAGARGWRTSRPGWKPGAREAEAEAPASVEPVGRDRRQDPDLPAFHAGGARRAHIAVHAPLRRARRTHHPPGRCLPTRCSSSRSGAVEVALADRGIILGPGDFFGEMGVLSGEPRSADVTAIDFTELLVLSRQDVLGFLQRHPELRAQAQRRCGPAQRDEPAGGLERFGRLARMTSSDAYLRQAQRRPQPAFGAGSPA